MPVKSSAQFERQVRRIYELLLDSEAEVTWDDHIPDPDNPGQLRQIDITIRRDEKFTLVECRKQRARQDVQWVEELIGRRTSLRADAVIAVSGSGFTVGALRKAEQHGIIARELQQLTDEEVKNWGRQVSLTLYFIQYSDLEASFVFNRESVGRLDTDRVGCELRSHPVWQTLFNAAADTLGHELVVDQAGLVVEFGVRVRCDDLVVRGEPVAEIAFRGNARLFARTVTSPAVFVYGAAGRPSPGGEARLQTFALGETSIVHDSARVSILLDISQLEIPPFCQFRFFRVSAEEEMNHEILELCGLDKLRVTGDRMAINIYYQ